MESDAEVARSDRRTERGGGLVVESVLRALRLLECFGSGEPELPLAVLSRRSGFSKTTTHRLLTTLVAGGWLERTPASTYRLTIRAFRTGSVLVESLDVSQVAPPLLTRLSIESGQTTYLVVAAGSDAVCLERVSVGARIRVLELEIGGSQPLHVGAAPRALLAFDQAALLPAVLARGLPASTPASLTTEAALLEDLEATRARGYAVSDGDSTVGVAAIGAPVFGHGEKVVGAISLGGLQADVIPPRPEHVEALLRTATAVSTRLGSRRSAVTTSTG
jgi:DNA-binding IclR family transcriptional regulator